MYVGRLYSCRRLSHLKMELAQAKFFSADFRDAEKLLSERVEINRGAVQLGLSVIPAHI